jgi:hypothetical protein
VVANLSKVERGRRHSLRQRGNEASHVGTRQGGGMREKGARNGRTRRCIPTTSEMYIRQRRSPPSHRHTILYPSQICRKCSPIPSPSRTSPDPDPTPTTPWPTEKAMGRSCTVLSAHLRRTTGNGADRLDRSSARPARRGDQILTSEGARGVISAVAAAVRRCRM